MNDINYFKCKYYKNSYKNENIECIKHLNVIIKFIIIETDYIDEYLKKIIYHESKFRFSCFFTCGHIIAVNINNEYLVEFSKLNKYATCCFYYNTLAMFDAKFWTQLKTYSKIIYHIRLF